VVLATRKTEEEEKLRRGSGGRDKTLYITNASVRIKHTFINFSLFSLI
jgi:hypothetical protein